MISTRLLANLYVGISLTMPAMANESDITRQTSPQIAPIEQALTLTQVQTETSIDTLLVTAQQSNTISGINLSKHLNANPADPLDMVTKFGEDKIRALAQASPTSYALDSLVIPNNLKMEQMAAGANYAAHGEEVGGAKVFLFPKYAQPTADNTTLTTSKGELLDYEIELCARFDRDINTMSDFQAATKGIFLCGDFTDRAVLLRLVDKDNIESGVGFTDGKSGSGRFPIGAFTVVPKDWSAFLANTQMTLTVNNELKQAASGKMMIQKLDGILDSAFAEKGDTRWIYQEQNIPLLKGNTLYKGQSILTGTPEGVTFRPPGKGFIAMNALKWIATGSFISHSAVNYVVGEFIEEELTTKRYLQPGDVVEMQASYLGKVSVNIIAAD